MSMQQQLTEEQIDAIYKYLSLTIDDMDEDEKKMWTLILMNGDPNFDDDDENTIDE